MNIITPLFFLFKSKQPHLKKKMQAWLIMKKNALTVVKFQNNDFISEDVHDLFIIENVLLQYRTSF